MKLSLLFLGLAAAPILITGCTRGYGYPYYRASDGAVSQNAEPTAAFRMTASRDLPCPPDRVRVFQLHSWGAVSRSSGSIYPFASTALEIADGCGQRVVYKEECGSLDTMLGPAMAGEARSGGETSGLFAQNVACRHLMISRLPIPPEAPVARWVVPPSRATDSVAPRFEDRAP